MTKNQITIGIPLVVYFVLLLWHPGFLGTYFSPLVYVIATAFLCYRLLSNTDKQESNLKQPNSPNKLLVLIWFGLVTITLFWTFYIYASHPIDIAKSDIIPLLKEIYYTRFIRGEFVYAIVNGYDYVYWTPNYLPMHWMPFVPAFYFGFDPRWISIACWLFATGMYTMYLLKTNSSFTDKLCKLLLPFIFLFVIFYKQTLSVAHNVELLIASFYMLLALALMEKNRFLFVVGSVTTLLSRYMSLFYLPIELYDAWRTKNKKAFIGLMAITLLVGLIYFVPFLSVDPQIFFKGAAAYDIAALGEWNGQSWQQPGDKPYQLFQGFGFASWFYTWCPGTLDIKIQCLKITLLVGMVVVILLFLLGHKKYHNHPNFKLVAFLVVLSVFPALSLVPYNYLFWNILFVFPIAVKNMTLFK